MHQLALFPAVKLLGLPSEDRRPGSLDQQQSLVVVEGHPHLFGKGREERFTRSGRSDRARPRLGSGLHRQLRYPCGHALVHIENPFRVIKRLLSILGLKLGVFRAITLGASPY
jgi:hypothetical protein